MTIDLSRLITAETARAQGLTEARATARATLLARIEAFTTGVTGTVPLAEKLSWTAKEEAARAFVAGNPTPAHQALLDAEAAVTGEPLAQLAARIIANADAWRGLIAGLTGLRRATETAIMAAPDTDAVATILAAALARIDALSPG